MIVRVLVLVALLLSSQAASAQSFREQLNSDLLARGDSGYLHACLGLSQRNIARGLPWRPALDSAKKAAIDMPPYYQGQCLMAEGNCISWGNGSHDAIPYYQEAIEVFEAFLAAGADTLEQDTRMALGFTFSNIGRVLNPYDLDSARVQCC